MSADQDIRERVAQAARRAYELRVQTGNGGNLSARLTDGERMVIKPSGVSFADCTPADLVEVGISSGKAVGGIPSREVLSHLEIYRRRSDAGAIFHCHAPWSVACAAHQDTIPPVTRHVKAKLGPIPVLRSGDNPDPVEVAVAIGELVSTADEPRAFVEAEHGIFSLADAIETAFFNAELVEETAQIALLQCQAIGLRTA